MSYIIKPISENISGSDLSSQDGDKNRTFTIANDAYNYGQDMKIWISGTFLHRDVDYTFDGTTEEVTFLNAVWNDQYITISYYISVEDSAAGQTELGSAIAVRRILRKSTEEVDDETVNGFLTEAKTIIKGKSHPYYMRDIFYAGVFPKTGNMKRKFTTFFQLKDNSNLIRVYINGEQLNYDTEFTYDYNDSAVVIDDSVSLDIGDAVEVYYCPAFFDDFANYMAAKRLVDSNLIDLPDGASTQGIYNNIRFTMNEYDDMLMSKPEIGTFEDHNEAVGGMF